MPCSCDPATLAALPLADLAQAQAMLARVQAFARQRGITLREPPPEPTTCCGRGCNGCVWEGWLSAVAWWREEALTQAGWSQPPSPG